MEQVYKKAIIKDLYRYGLAVSSIARIMSMTQSSVSRVISKREGSE